MANKKPAAGDPAPKIALLDDEGQSFQLSSLKGKQVILFFYHKSDTPG